MPIHLFLPDLRGLAAASLLLPLGALAQDGGLPDGLYAEITTPRGVITCELESARAPIAVTSFVGLAEGALGPSPRRPFFDGLTFHRVVPGFVIQGGDPLGTGDGGPGYEFPDEFSPGLGHGSAGILSMANEGPDTNGSQFFITLAPAERLDYLYSAFGHIVRGSDIPPRIAQGDVMRVRILRVGKAARGFKADQASFDALLAGARRYRAERVPGTSAHFDDPDKLLPTDPPRALNFNTKLANFERATGLQIYARLFAKFEPGHAGESPQEFADRLSRSLGLEGRGVLAVYFADPGKWTLSVGKSMLGKFMGKDADLHEADRNTEFERGLRIFFADSQKRETKYSAELAASLPNFLQIPGQKLKISVDAVLDELLVKASS